MSVSALGPAPGPAPPNRPVYLDNQATTRCDPRVLAAMLPWFSDEYGNPHSVEHAMGRRAEAAVDAARAEVAALLGVGTNEVVFTSGATEANNIAIKGAARHAARYLAPGEATPRRRIVTVATEHKCVLQSVADLAEEGFEPVVLPVGADGLLDPDALRAALAEPTLLVSVMAANNETGVLQDIPALAAIAKQGGALFHTDLAQVRARSRWRSTPGGSIWPRSADTRCTAPRVWARSMSAAARGSGSRRCSPAAGRSGGCAPAPCRRR